MSITKKNRIRKTKKPLVSIAIPTYNSAKTLKKTLLSLKKQTYKHIEIIVADGYSTDKTVSIARKYGANVCYGKELARARHEALSLAKGDYLLQLDSDQFIGKDVIQRCVDLCLTKKTSAVVLHEESLVRHNTFIEKLLSYDKHIVSVSNDIDPKFGAAIPRFFKTEILRKMRWSKNLSILDDAIVFQKNRKLLSNIAILEGVGISHYEVSDFLVFFKKFRRYGRLYISTLSTSPDTTLAHSLPRRAYFRKEVLLNIKTLGSILLLYCFKLAAVSIGILEELGSILFRPIQSKFQSRIK